MNAFYCEIDSYHSFSLKDILYPIDIKHTHTPQINTNTFKSIYSEKKSKNLEVITVSLPGTSPLKFDMVQLYITANNNNTFKWRNVRSI